MSKFIKIAVDGPSVSGKSSVAKQLAARLGFLYLDSGALYRSVALAEERGLDLEASSVEKDLEALSLHLKAARTGIGCEVWLGTEDISLLIRAERINHCVSAVAVRKPVRQWVNNYLHHQSRSANVVMDGRDIGTVVFPDAQYKFFVTASVEARTRRRLMDLQARGEEADEVAVREALICRDALDSERKEAPLTQAKDAILINNSNLDLAQTLELMLSYIQPIQNQEA